MRGVLELLAKTGAPTAAKEVSESIITQMIITQMERQREGSRTRAGHGVDPFCPQTILVASEGLGRLVFQDPRQAALFTLVTAGVPLVDFLHWAVILRGYLMSQAHQPEAHPPPSQSQPSWKHLLLSDLSLATLSGYTCATDCPSLDAEREALSISPHTSQPDDSTVSPDVGGMLSDCVKTRPAAKLTSRASHAQHLPGSSASVSTTHSRAPLIALATSNSPQLTPVPTSEPLVGPKSSG